MSDVPTNSPIPVPVKQTAPDVEHNIAVNVTPRPAGGFDVTTNGMTAVYSRPELRMFVAEGVYLASASRILNDCARYLAEKKTCYHSGQRVQLGAWTVVELRDHPDGSISVADGTELEILRT